MYAHGASSYQLAEIHATSEQIFKEAPKSFKTEHNLEISINHIKPESHVSFFLIFATPARPNKKKKNYQFSLVPLGKIGSVLTTYSSYQISYICCNLPELSEYTIHNSHYLHNPIIHPTRRLHNHCVQFLLGHENVPREVENNAYADFLGGKRGVLWDLCK